MHSFLSLPNGMASRCHFGILITPLGDCDVISGCCFFALMLLIGAIDKRSVIVCVCVCVCV